MPHHVAWKLSEQRTGTPSPLRTTSRAVSHIQELRNMKKVACLSATAFMAAAVVMSAQEALPNDETICPAGACSSPDPAVNIRTRWAMRRSTEFDKVTVAVLPLGSVEQHGPHLPVGTDLLLADAFATAIATHFDKGVAVLPASPFGASFEHASFPGTLAVPDDALQMLWGSLIASIAATGTRSVVLLNAHGGQTPNALIAARRARFELNPRVLAIVVNLQAMIHNSKEIVLNETRWTEEDWEWESAHGIHGGLVETSLMLYLHPESVDMASAMRFSPKASAYGKHLEPYGNTISYGWRAQDLFPKGASGDTTRATALIGRRIYHSVCQELRRILEEAIHTGPEVFST